MATTFTWDIQNLELIPNVNGNENVVFRVVWQCVATTDDGKTKQQVGVVELDTNVAPENFISVESLTREQIISWVKAKVAVKVVEDGLIPSVKVVSFLNSTSTTVAQAIAELEAQQSMPPATIPTPPTE